MCLGFKKHGVREGHRARDEEHDCAALWGRKACVASAHLYVVGSYSGALRTVLWAMSGTTIEWSWGTTSDGRELPELHTAAPGEMTQGLAHCRGMSSAEQEARKGDKRKLQSEPSLVYIVRNTHVNTPNTHAYHTHTKKLVHFL